MKVTGILFALATFAVIAIVHGVLKWVDDRTRKRSWNQLAVLTVGYVVAPISTIPPILTGAYDWTILSVVPVVGWVAVYVIVRLWQTVTSESRKDGLDE